MIGQLGKIAAQRLPVTEVHPVLPQQPEWAARDRVNRMAHQLLPSPR